MKKIVKSESGFLLYNDLCLHYGRSPIDSLIEHNIIHLRPSSYCSFDLLNQPKDDAVVTAESACGHVAMEVILRKLEKYN